MASSPSLVRGIGSALAYLATRGAIKAERESSSREEWKRRARWD
jgi:hypothetical protein